MPKFLTTEGLSKLLTNVKTVFATKTEVTTVVNDLKSPSNEIGQSFVHTSGNETIAGTKTFSSAISGSITGSSASCTGNAATATKATQDSAGQQINTTYIKGLSVSGKTVTYTKGDGTTGTITTQDTNTTYANFTKATSSAAGKAGLVPAPAKGYQTRFLRGDATWQTVSTSSDRRVKQQFADIPDAVLDAWENIHWMQFKMNDEVEDKGNSAAIHTGLVVQDIQDIFTAKGLDANLYDMVSHEEWEATEEEKDEDGNVVAEASPAYEQWYLRYEQALAIEAAYQRRRADRLEARIAALEAKEK